MVNKSLAYMYYGAQMVPQLLTETQVKRLLAPYKDQLYGLEIAYIYGTDLAGKRHSFSDAKWLGK